MNTSSQKAFSSLKDFPTCNAWEKITFEDHHGIALPLGSIRTEKSLGIGEFFDLLEVASFCKSVGFNVIQLLPINDTFLDCSPYDAISAYALNPVYLSLKRLPYFEKDIELVKGLKKLEELNFQEKIAYREVYHEKMKWLKSYYEKFFFSFTKKKDYQDFVQNTSWLKNYSLFMVLKQKFAFDSWQNWPEPYRQMTDEFEESLIKENEMEYSFFVFIQYLAFTQMKAVKSHLDKKGIYLMGDMPIFLNCESAEVWRYPKYFDLSLSAGVPPDAYNAEGQVWGFPLYRWEEIEKSDFFLWDSRIKYASYFYSLFRIDHLVGFFRVWAIEHGKVAKEGFFIPSEENKWLPQGKKILEALIRASSMLPIAEDLGTIPDCVRPCLESLGICSLKVLRWERNWQTDQRFIDTCEYPKISCSTVSTHDSPTLYQWWRDYSEESKAYALQQGWQYHSELSLEQRAFILRSCHKSGSLFHINLMGEYLNFIPEFSFSDPDDERINLPGIVNETNWTYRIKPFFSEISKSLELKKMIRQLLC